MNPTNREVSEWAQQQTDKKVLRQCATGFNLSTKGSAKSLKKRIVAHLQTLDQDNFADWNPTMVTNEQNRASLFNAVTAIFALTVINTILILIIGATVILHKDNAGFNRDQIVQIVNQTNYDTCVADVNALNAVIPDPANQLDPAATCG